MPYNHFDYVPSTVDRRRSTFKFNKPVVCSGYLGYLYELCEAVPMMPGSTLSLDIAAEIRSQALLRPLCDELYCDFFSFWVPNRIVWEHWKQFIGAVDDVLFNNLQEYNIPSIKYGLHQNNVWQSNMDKLQWNQCIACGLELPMPDYGTDYYDSDGSNSPIISALPFRGYTFIWNEYFRPEQLVAPLVFGKTDDGWAGQNMDADLTTSISVAGSTVGWTSPLTYNAAPVNQLGGSVLPVFRAHRDLYTSCLPAPSLETLNLLAGLTAPVGLIPTANATLVSASYPEISAGTSVVKDKFQGFIAGDGNTTVDVIADLNQTLLTVNNYRETIMLQNYYDVLNRAGSRFDSIIYNIFGVRADASLIDIPELVTHKRFTIYRNQVIATAETINSSNQTVTPVGTQAAYIDTVVRDNFFTKSTKEHGLLHMLWAIRPAHIRSQNAIGPHWTKLDKFSQYLPQFDGMGDVARSGVEKFYDFHNYWSTQKAVVFGYQEYGAEWKYQKAAATGWLDSAISGSLTGYVVQENFGSVPSLVSAGIDFGYISCFTELNAFAVCTVTPNPSLAPQFILDVRLTGTITHPMPTYNIPGQGALL